MDEVFFKEVLNDPQRRSCAQYCPSVSIIYASTPSLAGKNNYRVRYNGDILADQSSSNGEIELDCNQNYIPIGPKPIATCIKDGVARWSNEIKNNCRSASPCYVRDLNSNKGTYNDDYWFPVVKYITPEHRRAGYILSGKVETFSTTNQRFQKHGKCGYCVFSSGMTSEYRNYRRAILKSYSCNDGVWSFDWFYDNEYAKSCDEDEDAWCHYWENEESYPNELFLGWCTSDKDEAFRDFNFLQEAPDDSSDDDQSDYFHPLIGS